MNKKKVRPVALAATAAMLLTPLAAMPAAATPEGDNVVINEVSPGGKFMELYNPTDEDIDLADMYASYYSKAGNALCPTQGALSGTIEAGSYYLIHMAKDSVADLPDADSVWGCGSSVGQNGGFSLSVGAPPEFKGNVDYSASKIVDYVGLGTHANFEAATATSSGSAANKSVARTGGVDTDNNKNDFTVGDITPMNSGNDPEEPTDPVDPNEITPIGDIQGTGLASPLVGKTVTTEGFVTAKYPTGGKNGIYIQTEDTGGTTSHEAPSVGLFVYDGSAALPKGVEIGDFVQIKGKVSEYYESTQVTVSGNSWSKIDAEDRVKPKAVTMDRLPTDAAGKESLEGMLVDFSGPITVTDNYQNGVNYGEIGAAFGDTPLRQPSDVYNPTRDGHAALEAIDADNAERLITIDDGRTQNWNNGSASINSVPLPYISNTAPVRTGAAVELVQPAIAEYSNNKWKLQPVEPATTEAGNVGDKFFAFENDRPAAPAEVGGDVSLSGFNVLNYFTTTAEDVNCSSTYKDRQNNPITANSCNTVRGAANEENLDRQQEKIVTAINTLDSDVVSLEEIENSAKNGKDRDDALATLTDALNKADSSKNWEYVKSPNDLPDLEDQDVIRTAFIYNADTVQPVGESKILDDQKAFSNAREPLAQKFVAIDSDGEEYGDSFVAVVNHFKSKGSGTAAPDKWQGNANADRIKQADALGKWVTAEYPDTAIFIIGDLNAYSAEDPILKLNDHGYTRVMDYMAKQTGDQSYLDLTTYQYSSLHGSLDQALGNELALEMVTDAEVYAINAPEAIALEYSRYNNYLTIYHDDTQYRSSDHDPVKIGLDVDDSDPTPSPDPDPEPSDPSASIEGIEDGVVVERGQTVKATVKDAPEDSVAELSFHSDPVVLDSETVDDSGSVDLEGTVPEDAEDGDHELVVTLDGEALASVSVTIEADDPSDPGTDPSDPGTDPSDPGTDPSGGTSANPSDGVSSSSSDSGNNAAASGSDSNSGGEMPNTGASVAGAAVAALLLTAAGVVLVVRRRSQA
ncbi:ExeM/NucH family extracellular endonuclease [Ancrocorticia populi]|uniref:Glutamate--cysteine ligase n=1 Tax=Ancrocorticia populi TaxID=2175228 RepID=A0A2V1K9K7_9ACTO|nr:ExeM/NucH family extracellular endonuclease [Ancrocorticia populi]PWF26124.1 glutamate--cysteine ligase [Ancrocorticia populi]